MSSQESQYPRSINGSTSHTSEPKSTEPELGSAGITGRVLSAQDIKGVGAQPVAEQIYVDRWFSEDE